MTAFRNQYLSVSTDTPRWEKTADGFLRTKARILKESVMPYSKTELGQQPDGLGDIVQMYVGLDTISSAESLRTLEGCPIVIQDHNWLDPDTIATYGKGSVAGTPRIDGPYVEVDLLVTHPDAIADIESGKIGEISAAYHADSLFEPGIFDGTSYDARQVGLRYNHIAIIPVGSGRCGLDVRILNKDKNKTEGGSEMAIVSVRLRNTKRIINTDEEGAAALDAEQSASETKESEATGEATEKGKSLEEAMSQLESKNAEMSALQTELEELKGELSVYKEKLDELLSGNSIEEAAEGMNAEEGEADEILENMACTATKPEDAEKIKNSRFINGKKLRGEALHRAVLTTCGVKVENMSAEGVRGAFKAQHQIITAGGTKRVSGTKLMNSMNAETTVAGGVQRTALQKLGFK